MTVEIYLHDTVEDRAQVVDHTVSLGIEQMMAILDVIEAQVQQIDQPTTSLEGCHCGHVLIGLALGLETLQQPVTALKIVVQIRSDFTVMPQ